jgi:hypothetical protein
VSPPTAVGDQSYIIVTDAQNKGTIYHRGWVKVGSSFVLDDGADVPMSQGFTVKIYDDKSKANLLQKVSYSRPLCSSDFEFGNRFGASQIIEYTNDKQGKITLSAAGPEYSATLEVTIALTGGKAKASIKKISSLTSFNGFIDWTDVLATPDITKNSPIILVFPVEVDLFERRRHTV